MDDDEEDSLSIPMPLHSARMDAECRRPTGTDSLVLRGHFHERERARELAAASEIG